jgi:uncharacterized protein
MKIHLDIGHPAHVHYFRNFIRIMEGKGHSFTITARDKEVTFSLLKKYNLTYISRGKGKNGFVGKILYIFKGDWIILKTALKFKPNLFLSFGSSYAAHVAFILRKPHVTFDDTEHAVLEHLMSFPFSAAIITPNSYLKDLGKKQIRFAGFIELCYLHQHYFKADDSIFEIMGINSGEKFAILRFVSWQASHDFRANGINFSTKISLIEELSKRLKVFISSEGDLPGVLEKYRLNIPPDRMHDALAFATLYIGEGATMASECAMLGTPAIYVNSLELGYCTVEEKVYNLIYNFRNSDGVTNKAIELLETPNLKLEWHKRMGKMLVDKIDVTAFMVWFVEEYPSSFRIMKEDPVEAQKQFK